MHDTSRVAETELQYGGRGGRGGRGRGDSQCEEDTIRDRVPGAKVRATVALVLGLVEDAVGDDAGDVERMSKSIVLGAVSSISIR